VLKDSVILEHGTMSLVYWSRYVTIMILFRSLDLEGEGSMAVCSFKMSGTDYPVTWHHIPMNRALKYNSVFSLEQQEL